MQQFCIHLRGPLQPVLSQALLSSDPRVRRQPPSLGPAAPLLTPLPTAPVIVDDEANGLKEDSVLGIGVLHLLGLGRLLSLVEHGLKTLH